MQPQYLADAHEWIARAARDLDATNQLLAAHPVLGDAVAYHAQQVAEKALNGFLTAYGVAFRKTHLLGELLTACEVIESQFLQFTAATRILNPYVSEFRYPGGRIEPGATEARDAVRHATDILAFVRAALARASVPPASP